MEVKQPKPQNIKPFPDCWFETTLATFEGYLPEGLASGVYKVAPSPLVVNRKGLQGIQEAVDLMRVIGEKSQQEVKEAISRIEGMKEANTSAVKLVVEQP